MTHEAEKEMKHLAKDMKHWGKNVAMDVRAVKHEVAKDKKKVAHTLHVARKEPGRIHVALSQKLLDVASIFRGLPLTHRTDGLA